MVLFTKSVFSYEYKNLYSYVNLLKSNTIVKMYITTQAGNVRIT
jgi:hypothetical protein